MTTYAPGTVAMVSVRGGPRRVRAFRDGDPVISGWSLSERVASSIWAAEDVVTNVRPLVVLDLDDIHLPDLRLAFDRWAEWSSLIDERVTIANLIAAIEAQTRPPRIPEPQGLGAVVEDDKGDRWVRTYPAGGPAKWRVATDLNREPWAMWSSITAVKVLSAGVS